MSTDDCSRVVVRMLKSSGWLIIMVDDQLLCEYEVLTHINFEVTADTVRLVQKNHRVLYFLRS